MKTATIPLRVDPELRQAAEEQLRDGELMARAMRSRDNVQQTGRYVSADAVINSLESMLSKAKAAKNIYCAP